MTDVKDITPDLDRLDDQLDDLEENLQPLLDNLEGMASELPLLDKAKLFALAAYAIEALLFRECVAPGLAVSFFSNGKSANDRDSIIEIRRL